MSERRAGRPVNPARSVFCYQASPRDDSKNDRFFPNFQVAPSEREPEIELALRSIDIVVIRTTAREIMLNEKPFACGPSYLFIKDPQTVLNYYLDFEREWDSIPKADRQRRNVIQWLETFPDIKQNY